MELKNIKRGDKVVYITNLMITADKRIDEKNIGIVTSTNDKFAFVQYINDNNSKATRPEDLYSLKWRQDLADKIPDLPIKTL